jgi:hypothetical protein
VPTSFSALATAREEGKPLLYPLLRHAPLSLRWHRLQHLCVEDVVAQQLRVCELTISWVPFVAPTDEPQHRVEAAATAATDRLSDTRWTQLFKGLACSLHTLRFATHCQVSPRLLALAVASLPLLRTLSISSAAGKGDLISPLLQLHPQLPQPEKVAHDAPQCSSITDLHLHLCWTSNSLALRHLSRLSSLRRLHLSGALFPLDVFRSLFAGESDDDDAPPPSALGLSGLEELHLGGFVAHASRADEYTRAFSTLARLHTLTLCFVGELDALLPCLHVVPSLRLVVLHIRPFSGVGGFGCTPTGPNPNVLSKLLATNAQLHIRLHVADTLRAFAAHAPCVPGPVVADCWKRVQLHWNRTDRVGMMLVRPHMDRVVLLDELDEHRVSLPLPLPSQHHPVQPGQPVLLQFGELLPWRLHDQMVDAFVGAQGT